MKTINALHRGNRKAAMLWAAVLLLTGMTACIQDDDTLRPDGQSRNANLIITVANPLSKTLTRADSERHDLSTIENLNIVLTDGNKIIKILRADEDTPTNENITQEESGLTRGDLPTNITDEQTYIQYHIGTSDLTNVKDIYIVANYSDDSQLRTGMTVDQLKALRLTAADGNAANITTMFGQATPTSGQDPHGGNRYEVKLERLVAMVTVVLKIGNEGLKEGVTITPRNLSLHNIPTSVFLGQGNSAGTDNVEVIADGRPQSVVAWGDLSVDTPAGTTVGSHGNEENVTPLFMLENLQGTMDNNDESTGNNPLTPEITKKPDAGKEDVCSYIELEASYRYTPQNSNQQYISGPIKYRLYLGSNITDNFDVERNMHYLVTLTLKGMGGLVEDGLTDEDGNLITGGGDISWRVDTDEVQSGGSFLTDGIDMSSNGYLSWVGFVAEPGKEYVIYDANSSYDSWLMAYSSQQGYGFVSPSKSDPAKIYSYTDVPGGQPGLSYIQLFAAGWPHTNWFNTSGGGIEKINTIQDWIDRGYRSREMILAEKGGQEIDRLEVRQWLPMPVMVEDDGTEVTSGDPNDASMYYSRIDVYNGEELIWAPEEYAAWDASRLETNGFTIYTSTSMSQSRSYNAAYGFDNCAAFYWTDYKNGRYLTFQGTGGHPESAMEVAIYRAGNLTGSSGETTDFQNTGLNYAGLPTTQEWEKIHAHGVIDPRFGISSVPYWTSSMEGTQSYTYNYGSERSTLVNRLSKHRVRLIYHKNDVAMTRW